MSRFQPTATVQAFRQMLTPRTKLVAFVFVSNMLGSILHVHDVVAEAKKVRLSHMKHPS